MDKCKGIYLTIFFFAFIFFSFSLVIAQSTFGFGDNQNNFGLNDIPENAQLIQNYFNNTYNITLYNGTSFNETYDTWLGNSSMVYNHTADVYALWGEYFYNHTLDVFNLWGKWFYNQSDGSYNESYTGAGHNHNAANITGGIFSTGNYTFNEASRLDIGGNSSNISGGYDGILDIVSDLSNTAPTTMGIYKFANGVGSGNVFFLKARGSIASPAVAQANDRLGGFTFRGWGGSTWGSTDSATIRAYAAENFNESNRGSYITYETTPKNAGGARAERLRIGADGNVSIGTSADGTEKLDVNGNIKASGFVKGNGSQLTGMNDQHTNNIANITGTISSQCSSGYMSNITLANGAITSVCSSPSSSETLKFLRLNQDLNSTVIYTVRRTNITGLGFNMTANHTYRYYFALITNSSSTKGLQYLLNCTTAKQYFIANKYEASTTATAQLTNNMQTCNGYSPATGTANLNLITEVSGVIMNKQDEFFQLQFASGLAGQNVFVKNGSWGYVYEA